METKTRPQPPPPPLPSNASLSSSGSKSDISKLEGSKSNVSKPDGPKLPDGSKPDGIKLDPARPDRVEKDKVVPVKTNPIEKKGSDRVISEKYCDIVEDPLGHINQLLSTYDLQSVQHTLQTCQIVCSQLLDLQHTLNLLKYSILTDKYDDSLQFATKCNEQLQLYAAKKNLGFIKKMNEQHQIILEQIRKRLLENFDMSKPSEKIEDRTEQIAKLIELIGENERKTFVKDIARKICGTVPRDLFSKKYEALLRWISSTLMDDVSYRSLLRYDIKKEIVLCWLNIVRELIKTDDQNNFTTQMFQMIQRRSNELIKEYALNDSLSLSDGFDTFCERMINESIAKYTLSLNEICKFETVDMLKDRSERFVGVLKEFEKVNQQFKNPRNEIILLGFHLQQIEHFASEIKQVIIKSNSYTATNLIIIKNALTYLSDIMKQINGVYMSMSDSRPEPRPNTSKILGDTKAQNKTPVPSSGQNVSPGISGTGSVIMASISTAITSTTSVSGTEKPSVTQNSIKAYRTSVEDAIRSINKTIHQHYKTQITEHLTASMIKHRPDSALNNVFKKGKGLITNTDTSGARDPDLATDVSEQIHYVCRLLKDVNAFDDNIGVYLITDILVWYKNLIDIHNIQTLKKSAFKQIIMDIYQIKVSSNIQNTIFAEVEGRAKFLTGEILDDKLFVEQYIYFYPVTNVENFQHLVRYKGATNKLQSLTRVYSSSIHASTNTSTDRSDRNDRSIERTLDRLTSDH